jgi:hypothetical protein
MADSKSTRATSNFEHVHSNAPLAIRANDGGEFVTKELRAAVDSHGCMMETISLDKSSQCGPTEL